MKIFSPASVGLFFKAINKNVFNSKKIKMITPFTKQELKKQIGETPFTSKSLRRVRLHQGWWRLNVLNQIAGEHPIRESETVCNTIINGESSGSNFLTPSTLKIVQDTLKERTIEDGGKIEEGRLYDNLLSSQPLCFNFFAELENNKDLGLNILQTWWEDITKLNKVLFEYSPKKNYTNDGSAFDVAFDVQFGDKRGFIGLECKYTDTFSYKPQKSEQKPIPYYGDIGNKNYETFLEVYNKAQASFKADYFKFVRSKKFNQLFRNQLMAEAMSLNKDYDVVKTGLFCYENDSEAIKSGNEFQSMLSNGENQFKVITYRNFIESNQKLELTWEQREWTMLLWARYCGMALSESVNQQLFE